MNGCDHKFIDSSRCVKCGWDPGISKTPVVLSVETLIVDSGLRPMAARAAARMSSAQKVNDPYGFAERIEKLERVAHAPFDFSDLVARLERLERPVDSRDAIAWEIGHAAALRGDSVELNPFRRPGQ